MRVWKRVIKCGEDCFVGPYQNFRTYKFGEIIEAEVAEPYYNSYRKIENLTITNCGTINEGFHAYRIEDVDELMSPYETLCPAIIPAGTQICYGMANQVVATKMIVCRNLQEFEKIWKFEEI